MAYNSDGYIMFDFSDVDFRRASQTIEGLYDRCVKIIGTNKFILVINANGKTPLPSVCSFINNQYVIESCLYTFAITSNDTILIRRNDPDPSALIDDDVISPLKTWSSQKIDDELNTKADLNALDDYQPLLTAGDNISIIDNVISAKGVKSFTYTGMGAPVNNIEFPEIPHLVLTIQGHSTSDVGWVLSDTIIWGVSIANTCRFTGNSVGVGVSETTTFISFNDNVLTITSNNNFSAFNTKDNVYTVYYI